MKVMPYSGELEWVIIYKALCGGYDLLASTPFMTLSRLVRMYSQVFLVWFTCMVHCHAWPHPQALVATVACAWLTLILPMGDASAAVGDREARMHLWLLDNASYFLVTIATNSASIVFSSWSPKTPR